MKRWIGIVLAAGLCLCTACGSSPASSETAAGTETVQTEQAAESSAAPTSGRVAATVTATPKKKTSGNKTKKEVTLPPTEQVKAEIISAKLLIGTDNLVLDLEEKKENFSSQVVSANFFTTEDVRIYAEPAELVEIGDIRRNGDQNVLFSLTGKKAGSGNLYVASADGSVVSEPVAFTVRTAEEKEQAERPVYYTAIGEYWHFSEECAREDYPDAPLPRLSRREHSRICSASPNTKISIWLVSRRSLQLSLVAVISAGVFSGCTWTKLEPS